MIRNRISEDRSHDSQQTAGARRDGGGGGVAGGDGLGLQGCLRMVESTCVGKLKTT